ncbi:AAA family ATPase [Comamonas thiooxydans]|uniref:AAA family ATPase n=1 Tax=Comamonas thiooxydans TaxID=363952 RepID=UPI0021159A24|nr:ATP-binding protein [Comamonas thiooxydans]UUE96428.1 ATP-binding protein [Comamonas thiooxydans]
MTSIQSDLAQVVRLALEEKTGDVRLFVAKLVRKYRGTDPELAQQLDVHLRANAPRGQSALRKAPLGMALPMPTQSQPQALPVDDESRLSLLKTFGDEAAPVPLLAPELQAKLSQLIEERKQAKRLESLGLVPTRSAIFVGPPGVGKTITARWLAGQLGVPFYVLDLTAVMSSLLGRSGGNLRAALDFAKRSPCVLLLDEIDAIAKRRSDDGDVGELKRLVTVILQEVDAWPAHSVLLAATNHPELIDPALWRRFDLELEFSSPAEPEIKSALTQFLAADARNFAKWIDVLVLVFKGHSFSDIQREINRMRRSVALRLGTAQDQVEALIQKQSLHLDQADRLALAALLESSTALSQRTISTITGISRDTIRKRRNK